MFVASSPRKQRKQANTTAANRVEARKTYMRNLMRERRAAKRTALAQAQEDKAGPGPQPIVARTAGPTWRSLAACIYAGWISASAMCD